MSLNLTTTTAIDPDVRLEGPALSPRELWMEIVDDDQGALLGALHGAIGELVEDSEDDHPDVAALLEAEGVDALGGVYARWLDDAYRSEAPSWGLVTLTRTLANQTSYPQPNGVDGILRGPVALLGAASTSVDLEVQVGREFAKARAEQRRRFLRFLVDLSSGLEVRLVAKGVVMRRILGEHTADLPASVVNSVPDPLQSAAPAVAESAKVAAAAIEELPIDAPVWATLATVAQASAEELSYGALYAAACHTGIGKDAVRHRVKRLSDLGLVARVKDGNSSRASLLPAGEVAVRRWSKLTGHEIAIGQGVVNDPPTSPAGAVLTPGQAREGGEGGQGGEGGMASHRAPRDHWADLAQHHAAAAAAPQGGVAVVDAPAPRLEHPGDRFVSWSEQRDELVVGVEWDGRGRIAPVAARIAAGLASDQLLGRVLTPERLDGGEADSLEGLLDAVGTEVVARQGLGLGWLSDDDLEGEAYQDRLARARQELLGMTTQLSATDGSYRGDVAGEVLRTAHGLIGTLAHVYDRLGVDVTLQISMPEWSRNHGDDGSRGDLRRFLETATAICSRYGVYNSYKKLYEDRPEKREDSLQGPGVDPDSPIGESVVSWTIVGPGCSRLVEDLEQLGVGLEVHPEAVANQREFIVDVPVREGWSREIAAEIVARIGSLKGLRPTRETTSALLALVGSPHDLARAVYRLGGEAIEPRDLRLRDVRTAVAALSPARVAPSLPPGARRLLSALLRTDRALSTAALAAAADVDEDTVREHRELLEAAGLVDVATEDQAKLHRIRLPRPGEARSPASTPGFVAFDGGSEPLHMVLEEFSIAGGLSIATSAPELYSRLLPTTGADPTAALRELLSRDRWRWLLPWLDVLAGQIGEEVGSRLEGWPSVPASRSAELGRWPSAPPGKQLSLEQSLGLAAAD